MSVQDAFAAPKSVVSDIGSGVGTISSSIMVSMAKTRPWVLMFAILGFIGAGLMLIGSIGAIIGGIAMLNSSMGSESIDQAARASSGGMLVIGLFYLAITALYFFMSLYLLRYAGAIKRLKFSNQMADLEAALASQASFWKLVGIMILVSIVLGIVLAVFIPSMAMMFAGMGR